MTEREQIVQYMQSIAADFDPDIDALSDVLDSVSLLQLILHIEHTFDISLDVSNLTLDDFRSVDSVLQTVQAHREAG